MRTFDFAPLYRSTVGFDHLFRLLDAANGTEAEAPSYPPYNIERTGENAYRITVAVAGFAQNELSIELKDATLRVVGQKADAQKDRTFLHRGIAARAFERRFELADHVEVSGADLTDGLLHIDLVRNVPERLKPRQIAIGATATQIEAKAA
jgi:molecular chaperone IbpA